MNWIIIALASLILSAFFSGSEIAYVTSDRVRAEIEMKKGGPLSRILDLFYNNYNFFITTILVGNNVVLVIYGMGAAALLNPWLQANIHNEGMVLLCSTLISTGVILLTGEFFPKIIFRIDPNRSLRLAAIPLWIFYVILFPVTLFTTWLSRMLMRLCGIHDHERHDGLLSVGDLNQYLERTIDDSNSDTAEIENEVKIFHNALDFSSIHLRDCMTPRNEIVAVDITDTTRQQLSELFTTSGRSKIIVYRDDIDNVLGYIHVSELFDPGADWRQCIKPVGFAPETLLANKMMRRLLAEKRSMAIVVDEFGGTSGLVTLEDLVEEIFGDIQDEHDTADAPIREVSPGVWEISGRAEIQHINEVLHLDLPDDEDYQTIAGYILNSTGTIPEVGESVDIDGHRLEILRKSANRLELIRLSELPSDDR